MNYDDLIVLIPSHSLEDFPVEQSEDDAASLLNSFVVPWHPALLATAKVLPRWHRADDPPEGGQRRLVMLPTSCESWVPAGWADRVANEGSVVVRGMTDRAEMLKTALAPLEVPATLDPDLAADFLALGFCYLQIELLTRKMRNFSNLDEVHLQREAVAAAEAALAGDAETARTRLRSCFEVLTEARERFYPVNCHLIDLCLLIPRLADQHLIDTLLNLKPMNVLATAADLEEIATQNPAAIAALREAWDRHSADVVSGEWREASLPVLPLGSILWQFARGRSSLEKLFRRRPTTWGRRRYGLFPQLPQILKKSGYAAALHVVLDDGIYPDVEQCKMRWEGSDGTVIDGFSRIPLAAESATSYLRFPTRMQESMDDDHVAGVAFARWPEVKAPWFDDLRRMHNYSPCLGRWVTFDDFFEHTDNPTRLASYKPGEYLTPFLVQSVAREENNPISRYADHFLRRQKYEAANWLSAMRPVLMGQPLSADTSAAVETAIEELDEQAAPEAIAAAEAQLEKFAADSARQLGALLMTGAGHQPGYLIVNPLGFRRLVSIELPPGSPKPGEPGGVSPRSSATNSWLQWDDRHRALTIEVAGAGFVWVPAVSGGGPAPESNHDRVANVLMAAPDLLRNEFFEVRLNEQTGGILQVKGYGRSPNRLSQQLNYRWSRERTFTVGEGEEAQEIKSHYAEMRRLSSEVTCSGPALGEIVTTGEIVDQKNNQRLSGFKQTFRVWRSRPIVEMEIELDVAKMPDAEPWQNYYTTRFAWNDDSASLTRSALLGAYEVPDERFESPHYIEIATSEHRTTILPFGLPFHRKTGPRMIDTILVVPKETRRKFRFVIAIDQNYPLQAALDAMTPAAVIPTSNGPPRSGAVGWFFHLNARSVQILDILPLLNEPAETTDAWDTTEAAGPDRHGPAPGHGCTLRLIETEGRPIRAKLRCFRPPTRARQRDFLGKTITDLTIEGDAVLVDLTAHEIADIELRFD